MALTTERKRRSGIPRIRELLQKIYQGIRRDCHPIDQHNQKKPRIPVDGTDITSL